MIRVSLLSLILLFSPSQLQASFAGDGQKKQAEKPSGLRALRTQMALKKPTTLAAVVGGIAQIEKAAQEQPKKSGALSAAELEKITIELCAEEASDLKLPKITSASNVIGKPIGGSVCVAGQSVADISKFARLGYKEQSSFVPGQLVVVSQEKRCYYGLIVRKNDDQSYHVQVSDSAMVQVPWGDIASK